MDPVIKEIRQFARKLGPANVQYLRQLDATGGPAAVLNELRGQLSLPALEKLAAGLNAGGFHGVVSAVETDLRAEEQQAAQWLQTNGIRRDPNAPSMAHQATSLIEAAKTAGVDPVDLARNVGLADPAPAQPAAPAPGPVKPKGDRWRDHVEAAFENAEAKKTDPATQQKPEREMAHTEMGLHLRAAERRLRGESLDGLDGTPAVRAEIFRQTAAEKRARVGATGGDDRRADIERAYNRLEAQGKSEDDLARFDEASSAARREADELESLARSEEAAT